MYALQNDTGNKFNIELYIKVISRGTGWVYKRPITGNESSLTLDGPDR